MSADKNQCRRCSVCEGAQHHWLANTDFANDPAQAEGPIDMTHLCKHCPAVGVACVKCFGEGVEQNDAEIVPCPLCKGEGVELVLDAFTRNGLLRRTQTLKTQIEQYFNDVAYWNDFIRPPDVERIDPDPDGQVTRMLDGLNRTLAANVITGEPSCKEN